MCGPIPEHGGEIHIHKTTNYGENLYPKNYRLREEL